MDFERLHATIDEIDELIDSLHAAAEEQREAIDQVHETHRDGAINLVHYSALRNRDVRSLQARLASVGATRLTTTEPSVLPRLQAARNVLSAYAGEPLRYGGDEVTHAFNRADDILEEHADILLGENAEDTHSHIMVTLPTEAATDLDLVRDFVAAGMELARINCAHDTPEQWRQMIENVHTAAAEHDREIKVAMDLAGPKLRTGEIAPGPAIDRARTTRTNTGTVLTPAKLWLVPNTLASEEIPPAPAAEGRPTLTIQVDRAWLADLTVGDDFSFTDTRGSRRKFQVVEISDINGVTVALAHGKKNAYLSNATVLDHDGAATEVSGIAPSEQRLHLQTGDRLFLTTDPTPVNPATQEVARIGCTLPEAVRAIEPGDNVLFDDGEVAALAVAKQNNGEHTEVELRITRAGLNGTRLAQYKGINLPDTELPLPSLSEEDVEAFRFVARHAEIVNVSFIRDADDVRYVLDTHAEIVSEIGQELGERAADKARNLGIVLKIETIPAYQQLASVLLAGMQHHNLGIMIARGDLAVELGFERMSEVPRFIMNMAESAHVPTIMATQILESLAKSGLPTRAEITDAAYALRAECVMLNKGPHITDAIQILNRMSRKLGASQRKNRVQLRRIDSWGKH